MSRPWLCCSGLFAILLGLGCGGAQAASVPGTTPFTPATRPQPPVRPSGAATRPATAASAAPGSRSADRIRGIRGTLNHDHIVQTMEARQDALFACVQKRRRGAGWVRGDIRFAFKVEADGSAADVRAVESDVGNHEIESCLQDVLASTRFPLPSGQTRTRDFSWGMTVETTSREVEPLEADAIADVLEDNSREVYKTCGIVRRRNHYLLTAYVSRRGKILSLGGIAVRGREAARDKLPCVLDLVARWRLPRNKRVHKVSFRLR